MNPFVAPLLLAASALVVAAIGLGIGALAAFCAAPIAVFLLIQALAIRKRVAEHDPRRLVGAGFATLALGAAFAMAGAVGAGIAVFAAGFCVVAVAARFALRFDAPPRGRAILSPSDVVLCAGVALDEGVRLWWELARLAQRRGDLQRIAAEVRTAADRNHDRGWIDHPAHSHLPPPPLEKPRILVEEIRAAGRVEHLTFESEFEPLDPEIRDAYLGVRENRTAHAFLWRHGDRPRPTLISVPGYSLGRIAFDARLWDVFWLHRDLGLDLVAVVLPLHGLRASGHHSGAGFLDAHPLWTNAAMGQAVWDLRRLAGWLRTRGAPAMGVHGMCLGGCAAAVLSSVEPGLECAIPVVPVVSLENLFWRQMSSTRRAEVRASGLTEHVLTAAWARHSPLRMRPHVPHDARLIVGGLADRIIAPADVEALWEHWGRPSIHWFPGSHLVWRGRDAIRARLASHLRDTLAAEI